MTIRSGTIMGIFGGLATRDSASMFPYNPLRFAWLPDRDVEMAAAELDRRRAGQVGDVEVVEFLSTQVEPGFVEQYHCESLMQRLVTNVVDQTHSFASPSLTCASIVAV